VNSSNGKAVALVLGVVVAFLATAAILMRLIPAPRKETDYLVIGTLATFAALAVLFVTLFGAGAINPSFWFKRKPPQA
jgi:hypothetical protein